VCSSFTSRFKRKTPAGFLFFERPPLHVALNAPTFELSPCFPCNGLCSFPNQVFPPSRSFSSILRLTPFFSSFKRLNSPPRVQKSLSHLFRRPFIDLSSVHTRAELYKSFCTPLFFPFSSLHSFDHSENRISCASGTADKAISPQSNPISLEGVSMHLPHLRTGSISSFPDNFSPPPYHLASPAALSLDPPFPPTPSIKFSYSPLFCQPIFSPFPSYLTTPHLFPALPILPFFSPPLVDSHSTRTNLRWNGISCQLRLRFDL